MNRSYDNLLSFSRMPLFLKRFLFWSLCLIFLVYTFYLYTSSTSADRGLAFLDEKAKAGKLLFQKYNCTACHQVYGLGGYMGPDLTNVISAKGKGPGYAKAFLLSGTARMPNFHLSSEEIDNIIAYLGYVDKTGVSPIIDFKLNADGTVSAGERK